MRAPPRFLCDEMLGRLSRYLRAAGYDTLFTNSGYPDRELLRQCKEQGRYFLTQDQLIREHKAARGVAFILPQGDLAGDAAATKMSAPSMPLEKYSAFSWPKLWSSSSPECA